MAKLLKELSESVEYLKEAKSGEYYIQGIFLQGAVQNKNGRVYPIEVLEREVARYSKESIQENRAMGELSHPSCFGPTAQIVTREGVKFIKDIAEDEEILTLNLKTQEMEWQRITKKIVMPYKGKMISLKGRNIDTLVTPTHRFVIKNRKKELGFATAKNIWDRQRGDALNFKKCCIVRNIDDCWDAEDNIFVLPGVSYDSSGKYNHNKRLTEKYIKDVVFDKTVFSAFLGMWLAEGSLRKRTPPRISTTTCIYQNEGEKADYIRSILSKFPEEITWRERIRGNKVTFICTDYRLACYLRPLGKCYDKYIPSEFKDTSKENLESLIDAFIVGDGRGKRVDGEWNRCDVFSTSYKLAQDLLEIAIKLGCAGRFSTRLPKDDYVFAGRIIKAENKKPLHFVRMSFSKGTYFDNRFLETKEVDYDDYVYCVQVPNETFYAIDNHYGFWSGNSPQINLERVSHVVKKIVRDGNDFVGKAKILDTPYGKIAKNFIDEGVKLGVSTRGLGELIPMGAGVHEVQDFYLAAVDIVADPSAPEAFVQGIVESKEWIWDNGIIKAVEIENYKRQLQQKSKEKAEAKAIRLFQDFLSKL